ncbi:EamA family transporter [Guptibacillus hwajinpoensis]|uniref:DME family drug/metabolite transporter n=1 Tax=Guptibacillus hwajinpoensis TaxID=208199 RepID=A0ABU0K074_9BACL|nr:EamA family transporter [Alkalihalobacillus hemicentroti]MDQ0481823.1 DME family drug/metabolite transporter [Alkalihalobacillus hemicentroti]
MTEKTAPFLVLLAAILWGTTGTVQTLAPNTAHPVVIGAVRLLVGGIPLLLIVLLQGKFRLNNWPLKETLLASFSMACYQPLFFSAVTMTGVAIGTVIAIGSAPVLSGIIEWVFMKKSPAKVWWYSTILSIIGCLMIFINKESVTVDPYGIVMALGAGLSFAVYALVSGKLVETQSSVAIVGVVFTISALILSPLLVIFDMSWITEGRGIAVSFHLGIIATGLAYFLFARGLIYVPSSTAVTLSLAEPLTAALLGVFFIGEVLSLTSWLGIGFLLVGIGMLILYSRSSSRDVARDRAISL